MPRLRMKETSLSSTEEAVLRATRRASRKSSSKSKRHKSESISPPRNNSKQSDFDESSIPPSQAYKRSRTEEEEEEEEELEFQEKLKEASYVDQGIGYYEESLYYSTGYSSALRNATGKPPQRQLVGGMDEEEYAEYIRAGMWRLQNKERLEFLEKQEKLKKQRQEKDRIERIEKEKKSKLKKLKLERIKRDQFEKDRNEARERYKLGWNKLQKLNNNSSDSSGSLRFTDFVWPVFPPFALPPLSWPQLEDIKKEAIEQFLLPPSSSGVASVEEEEERRGKLRSAVLSYHPDRFERLVSKIQQDEENEGDSVRERVRELGLRVSQVLNDLLKEEKKKK